MSPDKVKAWCWEIWPKHWKELAPSSNSRSLFVKEVTKLGPDDDMLKTIELAIIAQTKHWRLKSKVEKVFGIPRLSQWIKDKRFDDEFIDESASHIQERIDGRNCKCGQPVHGQKYDQCVDCLNLSIDAWKPKRIETLKSLGLLEPGQSHQDVIERCKAKGSVNGKFSLKNLLGNLQMHGEQGK